MENFSVQGAPVLGGGNGRRGRPAFADRPLLSLLRIVDQKYCICIIHFIVIELIVIRIGSVTEVIAHYRRFCRIYSSAICAHPNSRCRVNPHGGPHSATGILLHHTANFIVTIGNNPFMLLGCISRQFLPHYICYLSNCIITAWLIIFPQDHITCPVQICPPQLIPEIAPFL